MTVSCSHTEEEVCRLGVNEARRLKQLEDGPEENETCRRDYNEQRPHSSLDQTWGRDRKNMAAIALRP